MHLSVHDCGELGGRVTKLISIIIYTRKLGCFVLLVDNNVHELVSVHTLLCLYVAGMHACMPAC